MTIDPSAGIAALASVVIVWPARHTLLRWPAALGLRRSSSEGGESHVTLDTEAIRAELNRLRDRDPQLRQFGANEHGYQFRPRATEESLCRFERQHRIRLPGDYRDYLAQLGNGGAGPFYGIFPLGLFDGAGDREAVWQEGDGIVGVLAEPFPHQEAWNLPSERLDPPASFASDAEQSAWFDGLDAEYWSPDLVNGAFPICHHGCALRTHLVVTGPEAGRVWFDRRAEYEGLQPHLDGDGSHMTFAAWYGRWLDECRRGGSR